MQVRRPATSSILPSALASFLMLGAGAVLSSQQAAVGQAANDDKKELCRVAGQVVASGTGEPLKKARATLTAEGEARREPLSAVTDETGHFSIEGVPAGRYQVYVERRGYAPQQYKQQAPDKPGAILALAPGQKIEDLNFRLLLTAVITGHIRDEDGEAVPRVSVQALKVTRVNGKSSAASTEAEATTNDLGEYRLFDLVPGRYAVFASSDRSGAIYASGAFPPYAPMYYPGTSDLSRAAAIDVHTGDQIGAIDMTVAPLNRTYKVRGHVAGASAEESTGIVVTLFPRPEETDYSVGLGQAMQAMVDAKSAEFEISNVSSGSYTLRAISLRGWEENKGVARQSASRDIDVVNADVTGITLTMTAGVEIPGRVILDGAQAKAGRVRVVLDDASNGQGFSMPVHATVKPDGTFRLTSVGDGTYRIRLQSDCGECYLKSVSAGGTDVLDSGLEIAGASPGQIEIVYSSQTGTVEGFVTRKDEQDQAVAGSIVVLVPDPPRRARTESYKSTTTDQNGRFQVAGVAPGKYEAFAGERDESDYHDAELIKSLEDKGEAFEIEENEKKSLRLKALVSSPEGTTN